MKGNNESSSAAFVDSAYSNTAQKVKTVSALAKLISALPLMDLKVILIVKSQQHHVLLKEASSVQG